MRMSSRSKSVAPTPGRRELPAANASPEPLWVPSPDLLATLRTMVDATASDPVLDALLQIARDSFPDIFEEDETFSQLRLSAFPAVPGINASVLMRHAGTDAFPDVLRGDSQLSAFADSAEGVFVQANTGVGWRIQASLLAPQLVGSAARAILVRGKPETLDILLAEVSDTLLRFRSLVAGEPNRSWRLIGFSNITLPDDNRLETPWGLLGPVSRRLARSRPFGLQASAVLETEFDLQFVVGEPPELPELPALEAHFEELRQAAMLLPIAVLLALNRERLQVPEPTWHTTLLPAEMAGAFSGQIRPELPMFPASKTLDADELASLNTWMTHVANHYDAAIEIAISRTLSAARHFMGRDHADALIDAVIAWENLVGPEEAGETTFRVTAGLAHLLESDPSKRDARRRQFARVYRARSKVVHGHQPGSLATERDEAVGVAIGALRRLFADFPDLIADRTRGTRLLLGDVTPPR